MPEHRDEACQTEVEPVGIIGQYEARTGAKEPVRHRRTERKGRISKLR